MNKTELIDKLLHLGYTTEMCCSTDQHNAKELAHTLLDEYLQAINYTHCCTELPTIEEIIVSEIRRKHQKQVDDEVERFLSGNGTDCRLRGFFSEPDINE